DRRLHAASAGHQRFQRSHGGGVRRRRRQGGAQCRRHGVAAGRHSGRDRGDLPSAQEVSRKKAQTTQKEEETGVARLFFFLCLLCLFAAHFSVVQILQVTIARPP